MAPLAAAKTFVLSTQWGVAATSSGPAVVASTGKIWSVWIVDRNTWIV